MRCLYANRVRIVKRVIKAAWEACSSQHALEECDASSLQLLENEDGIRSKWKERLMWTPRILIPIGSEVHGRSHLRYTNTQIDTSYRAGSRNDAGLFSHAGRSPFALLISASGIQRGGVEHWHENNYVRRRHSVVANLGSSPSIPARRA